MSIEKITAKIMEDAERQADEILGQARKQSDTALRQAKERAREILAEGEKNGQREMEKIISQRRSVADIDTRKRILEEKRALMEGCFSQAREEILGLPPEAYTDFLMNIIKDTGLSEGEIILNGRDRERVGQLLAERLAEQIDGARFTLSEEPGKFDGGLKLRQGKIFVNGTLEDYLARAERTMARDVSEVLFGGEGAADGSKKDR